MIEFIKWKYYSMLTWSKINNIKDFPSFNELKIFSNKNIDDNDVSHDINLLNKYNCDSYQKFISNRIR